MKTPLPKDKMLCPHKDVENTDMWFSNFGIEYIRENKKVRETVLPVVFIWGLGRIV